jgi:hypothetical protein
MAFQRHFRPERVDGDMDASTAATLKALIDGLGATVETSTLRLG